MDACDDWLDHSRGPTSAHCPVGTTHDSTDRLYSESKQNVNPFDELSETMRACTLNSALDKRNVLMFSKMHLPYTEIANVKWRHAHK